MNFRAFEVETTPSAEQTADSYYAEAIAMLQAAELEAYQEPEQLKAVYQKLRAALKIEPQNKQFLNTLGYYLLLIGNQQQALKTVHKVLALDPAEETALNLLKTLKEVADPSPEALQQSQLESLASTPWPQSEQDYDALYDDLEEFIAEQSRYFMQLLTSPEITLDPDQVEAQEQAFQLLDDVKEVIVEKMEILEQDLDIEGLWQQLKPLEQLHVRYFQSLRLNGFFQILLDGINGTCQEVQNLFQESRNQTETETNLAIERLYDSCDLLADELDQLSQQTSIALLEPHYESLLQMVQELQETLDERQNSQPNSLHKGPWFPLNHAA